MRCPHCGGAIGAGARFCEHCGGTVASAGRASRASYAPEPARGGGASTVIIILLLLALAGAGGWLAALFLGRSTQDPATLGDQVSSVQLGEAKLIAGTPVSEPARAPAAPSLVDRAPAKTVAKSTGQSRRSHRSATDDETIAEDVAGELPPRPSEAPAPGPAALPAPPPEAPATEARTPAAATSQPAAPEPESLDGHIDPEAVAFVVRHYYSQVRACYERQLRNDPEIAGVVTMRFTISPPGRIGRIRAASNTTGAPEIGGCIANAMRSWRFPSPEGGSVELEFPFRFGARGQLPSGTEE